MATASIVVSPSAALSCNESSELPCIRELLIEKNIPGFWIFPSRNPLRRPQPLAGKVVPPDLRVLLKGCEQTPFQNKRARRACELR
jgi:hypothetical protein